MNNIKNISIKSMSYLYDYIRRYNNKKETKNMKHAYMIICHNNLTILEKLLLVLDDERNDIYIHVDKKVKNFPFERMKNLVKKTRLYFVKRIKVTWGGYSSVCAEMILLEEAIKGRYSVYHLISGVDFPLKSQDYIHMFFEENSGKEFIQYTHDEKTLLGRANRIRYYYFFQELLGRKTAGKLWILHRHIINFQKRMCVDRITKIPFELRSGSNWFSVTHEFASYLVGQKKLIRKYFKYSFAADEVFLQSIAFMSPYKNNIINDNKRYIDWKRGQPYVFTQKEYEELIQSDNLFARKFDENVDSEIINKLFDYIIKKG